MPLQPRVAPAPARSPVPIPPVHWSRPPAAGVPLQPCAAPAPARPVATIPPVVRPGERLPSHPPAAGAAIPATAQRLLLGAALLGGAAALGGAVYGGYRYYRYRQRENTLDRILAEQQGLPITVKESDDLAFNYAVATDETAELPQDRRRYEIHLNPKKQFGKEWPERYRRQMLNVALIHEKTHVTVDRSYTANEERSGLYTFHATDSKYTDAKDKRWITLLKIIKNDQALTVDQREHMTERVKYSGMTIEWDPVINELLAYTKVLGVPANSATVRALVALADELLRRRASPEVKYCGAWPD